MAPKKKSRKKSENKKRSKKTTSRPRRTRGTTQARALPDGSNEEQLSELLEHLMKVRQQLLKIDPDTLDDDRHEQWRLQVSQTSLAITRVRNASLAAISAEFAAELPEISAATSRLAGDLHEIKTANDVIATVADVIGIIASVAQLLA